LALLRFDLTTLSRFYFTEARATVRAQQRAEEAAAEAKRNARLAKQQRDDEYASIGRGEYVDGARWETALRWSTKAGAAPDVSDSVGELKAKLKAAETRQRFRVQQTDYNDGLKAMHERVRGEPLLLERKCGRDSGDFVKARRAAVTATAAALRRQGIPDADLHLHLCDEYDRVVLADLLLDAAVDGLLTADA
jgi:hypothetical protein